MTATATDFDFSNDGIPYTAPKVSTYRKPDPRKKFAENIANSIKALANPANLGGKPHDAFKRLDDGRIVGCAPRYGTHRIAVDGIEQREFANVEAATAFLQKVARAIPTGMFDEAITAAATRKPHTND